jgi:hypothetical protein
MAILNIDVLDPSEVALAKVLVRNNLVREDAINDFINLKKNLLVSEKPLLGEILIGMKFITKADLDLFMTSHEKEHLDFVDFLRQKGFLTLEQRDLVVKKHQETGQNIATLLSEQQIMTKENYNKLFNNSVIALKLGEWLMVNNKVKKEELDMALAFRNVTTLENYLVNRHNVKKELLQKIRMKIGVE